MKNIIRPGILCKHFKGKELLDKNIYRIISLNNNSSYIMYSNEEIKNKLGQLLDCYDKNGTLIKSPAMLRKEIMKTALAQKSK